MAARLDLSDTLNALDRRRFDYLDTLPEELRKTFTASVFARFMSSVRTPGPEQDLMLLTTNEVANVNLFDIAHHPELQFRLIASCGLGRPLNHQWIPGPRTGRRSGEIGAFLREHWPEANDLEVEVLLAQFTRDSFSAFVLDAGCDGPRHKELLKAYDRHCSDQDAKAAREESP